MLRWMHRVELVFRKLSQIIFIPASFLYFVRIGKEHNYPTCCILHFAIDASLHRFPAMRRGTIFIDQEMQYVPCVLHFKRHPKWRPY